MNFEERRRRILALLHEKSGISAGELARCLGVSRMTVHRDLENLRQRGQLLRIRGGAVARQGGVKPEEGACSACGNLLLPHQRCELRVDGQAPIVACCTACGLRQCLALAGQGRLLVCDLISGRGLPAEEAFFLVNSMAAPCCRPSLLSFADQEQVALFQAGFGGSIGRFEDALEFLRVADNLMDMGKRFT